MEYVKDLPYQKEVVDRIISILSIEDLFENRVTGYSNPKIIFDENNKNKLKKAIKEYNDKISNKKLHFEPVVDDYLNLDIKMETGTGKTYVYVKTIYELAKLGIKKVIIVVPSLAIRAGTENFINDSMSYFARKYNNINIWLKVQEKGKEEIVEKFVENNIISEDRIDVLLLNKEYFKDNLYGKSLEDPINEIFYTKSDAIASINPFLIIDEPHRFKDENETMRFIKEKIKPQCVLRFGATFPEKEDNNNENKEGVRDYKNLIYDLDSRKAFLENYIKGINIFTEGKRLDEVVSFRIKSIKKGERVKFEIKGSKEDKSVSKGGLVDFLGDEFKGVSIENISDKEVFFSNGKVLNKKKSSEKNKKSSDEESTEYYNSYDFSIATQEAMIKLAIKKHFEKEIENFKKNIKTISLFFFDEIDAYRDRGNGKEQWLKELFEKELKEKLKEFIDELINKPDKNERELEYLKYLEVTLANLKLNEGNKLVHAGYFSDDKDKKEGSEYYKIIKDKEGTLNIYNRDNSFNTFRFIFSKWTLKEGWDNPNVFVITKLSGSGSETSKLQEVGRGLRLPVDINMKRIENEQFYLAYIVNHNEDDFATKLLREICPNSPVEVNGEKYLLTSEIQKILENKKDAVDFGELLHELITKKIIDAMGKPVFDEVGYRIIDNEKFSEEYFEYLSDDIGGDDTMIRSKVTKGEPRDNGKTRIRKENFKKIEMLWKILNQNFLISYKKESFDDKDMENIAYKALKDASIRTMEERVVAFEGVDSKSIIKQDKVIINDDDKNNEVVTVSHYNIIKYSEFIKSISNKTNIPIINVHNAIRKFIKEQSKDFNYNKLFRAEIKNIIIENVKIEKHKMIEGLFSYIKVGQKTETKLTDAKGMLKESINASDVGVNLFTGSATISDKYLYEDVRYDSPLELNNIKTNIDDKIEVFGKIPKNSIRIPKIDGATCSPDFMYVVKDKNGNTKKMNLVVESKNDKNREQLRKTEELTEKYMRKYFECLEKSVEEENISIKFDYQYANDKILSLIEDYVLKL